MMFWLLSVMAVIPVPFPLCFLPVCSVYNEAGNLACFITIMEINGVEEPLQCMLGYFGVVTPPLCVFGQCIYDIVVDILVWAFNF